MRVAGIVLIAEEFLAGEIAAAAHQRRNAVVTHRELMAHAALAGKAQQQRVAPDFHMPAQQGAEAVGAVAARVFAMADAHPGAVEQTHQRRDDAFTVDVAAGAVRAQPALHLATQAWHFRQLGSQLIAIVAVGIFSAIATALIALGVSLVVPMRVTEEDERQGLDVTNHGERGWEFD